MDDTLAGSNLWDGYNNIELDTAEKIIKSNLNGCARNFVAIGFYLKDIRDNETYLSGGYDSIWDFAKDRLQMAKSTVSRFMAINDRFSVDGNTPVLMNKYLDFGSGKLQEMLTMTDEEIESIDIDTTVKEIRKIKKDRCDAQQESATNKCFIKKDLEDGIMCSGGISDQCNYCDKSEPVEQEPEPITIDDLDLSVSAYNSLKKHGIHTISQLCEYTENELLHDWKIGDFYTKQIIKRLDDIGRCLKQEHQLPSCPHEAGTECNMINIKPIAESLGADCNGKCCWGCKELCGARCNASGHRPDVNIEPEIVDSSPEIVKDVDEHEQGDDFNEYKVSCDTCGWDINGDCDYDNEDMHCITGDAWKPKESDSVKTVEADIIQSEPEEIRQGTSYSLNSVYMLLQKAKSDYTEAVRVSGAPEKLVEKRLIIQDALLDYYQELRGRDTGWYQKPQPELPTLKNNEQRKEFIEAYASWPIWIDQEETGERYYRYNLTDKVAMVVKVSLKHIYQGYKETKEIDFGAEQYYLLGIKSEWTSKGNTTVEDETRTFYECNTNKSALVDYLKEFQKK